MEKAMKSVRITLEGGVIQTIVCPVGVKVIVRDYDTDGGDEEHLQQDDVEYTQEHNDARV
jgi:hypothetical protein